MAVTSNDIAKACGVSQGSVDRALNDRPGISPRTKQKILETAKQMGYRPHLLARYLVNGRTMTLGLIILNLKNQFFTQLVNSMVGYARQKGYFIDLAFSNKNREDEARCLEHLADRQVDGFLLFPVGDGQEYVKALKDLQVPVLTVANRTEGDFPFVGIDDYAAMKDITGLVIKKGYSRLVYVSPSLSYGERMNIYATKRRYEAFCDCVNAMDVKCSVTLIDSRDYLEKLRNSELKKDGSTAILCTSDIYALEIMKFLEQAGFEIPRDIGLTGFDSIDMLRYISPSLTTVSYSTEKLAHTAVDVMVKLLNGEPFDHDSIIAHSVIKGETLKD